MSRIMVHASGNPTRNPGADEAPLPLKAELQERYRVYFAIERDRANNHPCPRSFALAISEAFIGSAGVLTLPGSRCDPAKVQKPRPDVVKPLINSARTALMDNWAWGVSLIALTIAMHVAGVTFLVSVMYGFRVRLGSRRLRSPQLIVLVVVVFTAMGLLLVVLHGIEVAIWAMAYLQVGALDSLGAAILYSVDTMATRGASRLLLQPHWQMMGALEAADGMLLFGISTAFIFTVMQFYYQHLVLLRRPGGSVIGG
jgi:hypothetical protein